MDGFAQLSSDTALQSIDALTTSFFRAFDNRQGPPDIAVLHQVVLPTATVIQASADETKVLTLEQFIEPRRKLLCGGPLTNFHEWEEEAATFHFGAIASRVSRYRKQGTLAGEPYTGHGWKCFQLCLTQEGWRIAAFSWADEHDGLPISAASWCGSLAQQLQVPKR